VTALLALVFALVNTPSGRTMLVSAGILLDLVPLLAVREGFFPEVRNACRGHAIGAQLYLTWSVPRPRLIFDR